MLSASRHVSGMQAQLGSNRRELQVHKKARLCDSAFKSCLETAQVSPPKAITGQAVYLEAGKMTKGWPVCGAGTEHRWIIGRF